MKRLYCVLVFVTSTALLLVSLTTFGKYPALGRLPLQRVAPPAEGRSSQAAVRHPSAPSAHLGSAGAPELTSRASDAQKGHKGSIADDHSVWREQYAKLPLSFESNLGQTDPRVKFLSRGSGYTLFLTQNEAVLTLHGSKVSGKPIRPDGQPGQGADDGQRTTSVLHMKLAGANPHALAVGADKLPGKINYFIGNDPQKWHSNIPTYSKVEYRDVYPGVDLMYYGNKGQLEYDFAVSPGADPRSIRLRLQGADKIRVSRNGDLLLSTREGEVRLRKPKVYQTEPALARHEVSGRYVVRHNNEIGFEVGAYNPKQTLIIDPVLVYSSYLGGSNDEKLSGMDLASGDEMVVTGDTDSDDFPTQDPYQPTLGGTAGVTRNVFITELSSDGASLVFSTYLGGNQQDGGWGLVVDSSGNIYVDGFTSSADFPVTSNAYSGTFAGTPITDYDIFLSKFDASGSRLLYSSYVGQMDFAIVLDGQVSLAANNTGQAYLAGTTNSSTYPTTPGAFQTTFSAATDDGFISEIDTTKSGNASLVYSTFLGANHGVVAILNITLDSSGNIYATGHTPASDFPVTTGAYATSCPQSSGVCSDNAFVTKINPAAPSPSSNQLVYSTYFGGNNTTHGFSIAVDSSGATYSTGFTLAPNLPVTSGAFQTTCGTAGNCGIGVGYVTKINPAGQGLSDLVYATYLSGDENDLPKFIVLDSSNDAYIVGRTTSDDFPVLNPLQAAKAGPPAGGSGTANAAYDGFITELNPTGTGILFSTYNGGSNFDSWNADVLDSSGNLYVGGRTSSMDYAATAGAFQPAHAAVAVGSAGLDAMVAKISPTSAAGVGLGPATLTFGNEAVGTTSTAQTITLTAAGSAELTISKIIATGPFGQTNTCGALPATLTAGTQCTISITFSPLTTGSQTGTLMIDDNASPPSQEVPLAGTGTAGTGAGVSFSPASVTFASQTQGTTSVAQAITLTNNGGAALSITSISITGTNALDFAQTNTCGTSVAAGTNCSINVTFTPTLVGYELAFVTVADNVTGSPQQVVGLTGTGTSSAAPAGAVALSPANVTFGAQATGTTSSPLTVTLTNVGNAALSITSVAPSTGFGETNTCGTSVAAGATCTIGVTFSPATTGAQTGTVVITDGAPNSPQTINLAGTGGTPTVTFLPSAVTFASQAVGTASASTAVTLTNTGGSALSIVSLIASGDFSQTNTCGTSVAAAGTCTISVSFQPSAAGTRIGYISVSDSDATNLQTLNLTGTGSVPTSTVVVSPPHASLTPFQTQQFVATISGTVSSNVTWSVDGTVGGTPTAGTISTSGVYTPPMTVGSHTVTVASVADPSQTASAQVVTTNVAGIYTRHNDNARDGQNLQESVLTTGNVNPAQFGLLYSYPVDAYTYAQPLYVANVNIPGQGNHNVIYVATENNSIFAYDADGLSPTPLWQLSFINPAAGITTLGESDVNGCTLIGPQLGITATPVIDPVTQTMYVVVSTKEVSGGNTNYYQRLHALDITTGAERPGSPVVIQGQVTGTGHTTVTFSPQYMNSRAGLLLSNGVVYASWSFPCNVPGFSWGWLMGYDESSLAQVALMSTTPDGTLGGVWPNALPADSSGNIFASTGDGTFDANTGGDDYGDTYMKLVPNLSASPVGSFTVADYFTPSDQSTLLSGDIDLSPGGPMLLPDQPTAPTHLMVGGGKEGTLYLVNRDTGSMGGYSSSGNNIIQTLSLAVGGQSTCVSTVVGSSYNRCLFTQPAFWQNQVFYQAPYDYLKDFRLSFFTGQPNPSLSLVAQSPAAFLASGSPVAVSANGSANGIVWTIQSTKSSPATLRAYDGANITRELYDSSMAGSRDTAGTSVKFDEPTVVNGKVFVPTSTQLNVYGLLTPPGPSLTPAVSLAPSSLTFASQTEGTTSGAQVVTLTNTGVGPLSITSISITGADPGDFGQTNTCGASVAAGGNCTISVTFTPAATSTRTASVSIADNAAGSPQTVSLTGTGTPAAGPPAVSLSPTSLTFPLTVIGQAAPPQVVTLTNTGTGALSITSITIASPGTQYYKAYSQTNNCGTSVAAGASCTINVTYTAKQSSPPVSAATLSIADNATGSPQTVALSGTGTFVKLVPASLTFASQAVGTTSAAQTATLTNTLGQTLTLTISITGTNPTDFAQTNTCGGSVAAGASCTFNVTFAPTAAGTRAATLSIADGGGGSPQTVALTGTATSTVTLSPTSVTFSTPQAVGTTSPAQAVTLSNTGATALSITGISITGTNPADFAQTNTCGTSVAAATSCTINVTFTPNAAGTLSASVSITDNGPGSPQLVSLTGTGTSASGPTAIPAPTSLTFASQTVGVKSAAQAVTLTNSGGSALSITSITITGTNPGDFGETNTCGTSVAASANCTISVTFTPAATGTRTASISIADNATGSPQTVTLTGTGASAPAPAVTLAPTSLTFTGLAVGTPTAAQTVALTNSGSATLSITSVSITGANSGDFAQSNNCGTSVVAGASCTITVTFTPLALGIRTASVSIADNATGSPQTVALTGTTGPVLSLSPSTGLTFPQTNVGSTSSAQTVTLTNTGNSTLTPITIALTGTNNGDFSYTSTCGSGALQPSASCTLMVTFKPTATGSRSASITITDNAPGSPQTVSLSGTGITTPGASLSPGSLTFASQEVGSTSPVQTVTLTNNGSGTLTITSVSVTNSNFGQTTTCGTSLAVGASCTITVSFKPGVTGSSITGSVMVADDAPDSPQAVALTGTAVAAGVGFSPSTGLVFKGEALNTPSSPQTVTLTNTGTAALTISSIAFTGSDAADFAQTNNCPPPSATLSAAATCTISVVFNPTTSGNLSAALTVTDNAPGSPHSLGVSGAGSGFELTAPTSTASVAAGQPASYALNFAATGGFSGMVTLSCTTTAPSASCSVAPATLTLNAPNTATATATVTTTAGGAALPKRHLPPGPGPWIWWVLAGVAALGFGLLSTARQRTRWALAGAAFVLLLAWAGCGGGGSSTSTGPSSTPAGQYQVTVTANSASASQNVMLTLTVQ